MSLRRPRLALAIVCGLGCLCPPAARAASVDAPPPHEHADASVLKSGLKRFYVNATSLADTYDPAAAPRRFTVQGEGEVFMDLYNLQFNMDLQVSSNRSDREISVAPNDPNDIIVEQAYVEAPVLSGLTLMGGLLHNPLGYEAEDAPDRDQISHGQVWNLINDQTHLPGNSVQGVAFNAQGARLGLFAGFMNDLGEVRNRHSAELLLRARPLDGMHLEGGFLTQSSLKSNPASAETLFDLNGEWRWHHVAAAAEYFAGDKLISSAWGGYGHFRWGHFLLAARGDWVRYLIPNIRDTTSVTVTGAFLVDDRFKLAVEYRLNSNPNTLPVVLNLPQDGSSIRFQALVVI